MGSRNIQTGVEHLAESLARSASEDVTRQWRDLRNKIDSILLSTTTYKTDEIRKSCQKLDELLATERKQYITSKWGPAYFQKVEPLLLQLEILERKIAAANTSKS